MLKDSLSEKFFSATAQQNLLFTQTPPTLQTQPKYRVQSMTHGLFNRVLPVAASMYHVPSVRG